ncbi:MAG TPA: helix-turn-helix domain-containing GNAT family N-acetyltransferase [Gaiellaceae bacterium]|jgi:DNA-binding MarR family transcriptional regulator/GNAT superfamily N-acetyltransferase|nr:helix-turn-helix domain-containing GNAT family N-acetyltransferase [Gaiellaceae bacterium]
MSKVPTDQVERFRAFNRFHTRLVGALDEHLLDSPFTLTEARVLFELGRGAPLEIRDLRAHSGLDAGYLSRILAAFEERGLVVRERSAADARAVVVSLTGKGLAAYRELDRGSAAENAALLERLRPADRERLLLAAEEIESLLAERAGRVTIRTAGSGDYGWLVERHGVLYAAEYGWDVTFEGLVAEIAGSFARGHDPQRERAWIAELDGRRAGCILCVREDDETAKLRVLLVEPWARGHGIGSRLVDECIEFARSAGYRRLVLWTNDVLAGARRIYERAGFTLVDEGPHEAFGHRLVEQTWAREL